MSSDNFKSLHAESPSAPARCSAENQPQLTTVRARLQRRQRAISVSHRETLHVRVHLIHTFEALSTFTVDLQWDRPGSHRQSRRYSAHLPGVLCSNCCHADTDGLRRVASHHAHLYTAGCTAIRWCVCCETILSANPGYPQPTHQFVQCMN